MSSASIASLESAITSYEAVLAVATPIYATAKGETANLLSRKIALASASLAVASDELMIATATASSAIASATSQLASDEAILTQVQIDTGFYSGMVPSFAFNLSMAIIFGIFFLYYAITTIYKQWWFSISMIIACLLEVIGYCGRVVSNKHPMNKAAFLIQFICLTIAPVFTMAAIYYQLAKLAQIFGAGYSRLKPLAYSYIFITSDVLSLFIQAIGGGKAGTSVTKNKSPETGTHIMVAGLALQVASMTLFLSLWLDFMYAVRFKAKKDANRRQLPLDSLYNPRYAHLRKGFLYRWFPEALTLSSIFILVRCVYRVCELGEGWTGYLMTHESYFIALDGVMVSAATLVFLIFFPGKIFDGRHTSIPVKTKKIQQQQQLENEQYSDRYPKEEEYSS